MPDTVDIVLQIDRKRFASWRSTAARCNLALNDWIIMGITLADQMHLVEGSRHFNRNPRRMDPLLAEAVRRAAQGKPWEHKALLIIGPDLFTAAPGETPENHTVALLPASTDIANDLLHEYGLPYTASRRTAMHARLGPTELDWYETVIVLYIHDNSDPEGWAEARSQDLADMCGTSQETIRRTVQRLILLGRIIIKPGSGKGYRVPRKARLDPSLQRAIEAGAITPISTGEERAVQRNRRQEVRAAKQRNETDPNDPVIQHRLAVERYKLLGLIDP